MLRGTLLLRYCTSRFAHKLPTWSLRDSGGVAMLVHSGYGNGLLVRSDPSSSGIGRISDGFGVLRLGRKRVRLRRKTLFMRFFGHLLGIILGHEFGIIEAWGFFWGR